eukprot:6626727-Pyramimonas_sp.AAC.1
MGIPAVELVAVVGWGDAAWAARVNGESHGGEIASPAPLSPLSRDKGGEHRVRGHQAAEAADWAADSQ